MTDLKKGDTVRLLHLDGSLSKDTFVIHDIWGDETYARNASYIIPNTGGEEQQGNVTSYVVHRVSKWTTVDGMGALSFPRGIDPVEIARVDAKKGAKA